MDSTVQQTRKGLLMKRYTQQTTVVHTQYVFQTDKVLYHQHQVMVTEMGQFAALLGRLHMSTLENRTCCSNNCVRDTTRRTAPYGTVCGLLPFTPGNTHTQDNILSSTEGMLIAFFNIQVTVTCSTMIHHC